jgi:hypothetical protein
VPSAARADRESLLWLQGATAAQQALDRACRQQGLAEPPAALRVVDVCDRGGDSFEFLAAEEQPHRWFLVRSNQDRRCCPEHAGDHDPTLLHGYLRTLPERGRREITVQGRDGKPTRPATVAVRGAAVRLLPPSQRRGQYRRQPLAVWALHVWEVEAPPGVEPVEWFLLTNVPVPSLTDTWEKVDWYCGRWVVEEYHKAQKTGCDIESPPFPTAAALQPMIALVSVAAVSLLNLRDGSRDPALQDRPASALVPEEQVEVLSGWRYGQRRPLTVREFFAALARLGGHQNRQGDHPPGWLVLWRGWQSLQLMVIGARAARCPPASGPPESSGTATSKKRGKNR